MFREQLMSAGFTGPSARERRTTENAEARRPDDISALRRMGASCRTSASFPVPVVMTTAINANSSMSKARDPRERRAWYTTTLRSWMQSTRLAIVVVDASVTAAKELEFLRPLGPAWRLELLALPRSTDAPAGKDKGYREYLSIAHAAAGASRLLRNRSRFAHATGNRFVPNAEQLLSSPAAQLCSVGVVRHGDDALNWRAADRPWLDSSFVLWTRTFLLGYFDGEAIDDKPYGRSASRPFEVELARGVMRAHRDQQPIAWFDCVAYRGWSGARQRAVHSACSTPTPVWLQVGPRTAGLGTGAWAEAASAAQRQARAAGAALRLRTNHAPMATAAAPASPAEARRGAAPRGGADAERMRPALRAGADACSFFVPRPVDPSPIRSPQAVHSALLPYLAGRELVEIGTRNGDGMMCFARVARRAVAVEMDQAYCAKLRQRSAVLDRASDGRNFSVHCKRYEQDTPDADIFTWWQAVPRLTNEGVLAHLSRLLRLGSVRESAEALVLFDNTHGPDVASLRRLRRRFRHSFTVHFDEHELCLRLLPPHHPDRRWCPRARGKFTVGIVPISSA